MPIFTIALNTFRETVRDRVLYSLAVFVLLLVVAGVIFSQASLGQEARVLTDIGLSVMRMFGVALAVFIGTSLVAKEIERRTIAVLLAKPIQRSQFIIGKYLGLALTLSVNVVLMASAVTLALLYAQGQFAAPQLRLWQATLGIFLELLVLTAIALCFSAFSSQFLAALLTILLFILGNWNGDFHALALNSPDLFTRWLSGALAYLVPNLPNLNFIATVVNGQSVPGRLLFGALAYTALYVAAWLAATVLIFQRRNFK